MSPGFGTIAGMKSWKKLSQKTLLEHDRLNVYEDEVELPNGQTTKYIHFGKHHDAACVIGIRNDGKILVQKEYSYPPRRWMYQFPGGGIDKNETPEKGVAREFAEEANLKGDLQHIGKFYMDNRRREDVFHVFIATNLSESEAPTDPEEEFETHWMSEAEIDQKIYSGEIVNYTLLSAWSFYKSYKAYRRQN